MDPVLLTEAKLAEKKEKSKDGLHVRTAGLADGEGKSSHDISIQVQPHHKAIRLCI